MTTQKPEMLTERSLVLAKLETTRGVDSNPTIFDDAFLVGDLSLQLDPTTLDRNVMRPSFSPIPKGVGRKLVNISFSHEIKSSGDVGITRPKIGTLMLGCAFREEIITAGAATQIETPIVFGSTKGAAVTWAKTTAPTSKFGSYLVECVLGGASTVAKLRVTRWASSEKDTTVLPNTRTEARVNKNAGSTYALDASDMEALTFTVGGVPVEGDTLYTSICGLTFAYDVTEADEISASATDDIAAAIAAEIDADARITASATGSVITVGFESNAAAVAVESGTTALALGDSGAEITPTFAGNLVKGQMWIVSLYEEGYMYRPTSESKKMGSLTLYVFMDGLLHVATASMGTVTFTGEAGGLGKATFEFTCNYADPVEEPMPFDATLEETQPSQVELAQMSIMGDNDFCAQSFTYTLANTINPRDCMNAADGYNGSIISNREPTAALNPEATYEAYTGMWKNFSKATQFPIHNRVGTEEGNIVRFYAERVTYTGLTYGDRNGTTTLEAEYSLNGLSSYGDDELRIAFC
jgi:hypothetical protein